MVPLRYLLMVCWPLLPQPGRSALPTALSPARGRGTWGRISGPRVTLQGIIPQS